MIAIYIYLGIILVSLYGDVSCMITAHPNARVMKYVRYTEPKHELVIPIMIHYDTAMAHQASKIYGYKKTKIRQKRPNFSHKDILREVEKVYSFKNLNQRVKFNLLNIREVNDNIFNADKNISRYLGNYCTWQAKVKDMNMKPFFSVLLTGLDLYHKEKVTESKGRGYMGQMCSLNKSCAVVKWHPKDLVYLLAHEIAHSLGVYHDGTHNSCRTGFIMNPQYSREEIPQYWSTCSRTHLQEFLRDKEKSWCLSRKYTYKRRSRYNYKQFNL